MCWLLLLLPPISFQSFIRYRDVGSCGVAWCATEISKGYNHEIAGLEAGAASHRASLIDCTHNEDALRRRT